MSKSNRARAGNGSPHRHDRAAEKQSAKAGSSDGSSRGGVVGKRVRVDGGGDQSDHGDGGGRGGDREGGEVVGELVSMRAAAGILGISAGQLSEESKRNNFPWRTAGRRRGVMVEEVRQWRRNNIRQRKMSTNNGGGAPREEELEDPAHDGGKQQFIDLMMGGEASAIEISRAAMQLASRHVAHCAKTNTLNAMDLDGLKKTLQELRTSEFDHIELQKMRRELIPREEVEEIVGAAVSRLVRCLAALENAVATEVALWLEDPKVQKMPHDDRARMVREFVGRSARAVRQLEADGVEKMLAAGKEDEEE